MSNNNASINVSHDALVVVKPENHRSGSKGHHQSLPQDSEENRGSFGGAQSSTSVVDQVRTPPEDAGVTSSASTICPAPVCRQFWKAGSYNDELSSKSQQPSMTPCPSFFAWLCWCFLIVLDICFCSWKKLSSCAPYVPSLQCYFT